MTDSYEIYYKKTGFMNGRMEYALKKSAQELGFPTYEGGTLPLYGFSFLQRVTIAVGDPDIVKELFTSKNLAIDKNGFSEVMFKPLLGNSFLFSKSDDVWKIKRKACAHAFYKDRMESMMKTLQ